MIEHPRTELFDINTAREHANGQSPAEGRGHAVFFHYQDHDLVLKHYQRGGKMAALLGDNYIGTDCNRSRSFREWRLLRRMCEMQLPVPTPLAASCIKHGLFNRADLVTLQISNVTTLADRLLEWRISEQNWKAIGSCIRRFHDASVYHADLNARNILLNAETGDVYLIDFDKGSIRFFGDAWKAANLARLQRSMLKFKSLNRVFHYNQDNWNALLDGYNND